MNAGHWVTATEREQQAIREASAGQVVQIAGKRYKITKKATTAVAIKRWFWWDEIGEAVGDIWERLFS